VQIDRILPLFNINGPIFQIDRNDFAELLTAQMAQVLVTAEIGILRRKAVSMNRCPCAAPNQPDESKAREAGSLVV
jgi:hypothetical protein